MFDSREYQWSDISVLLGGVDLVKLQAVKYSVAQEKKVIYGKGSKPVSVQRGNYSYEGAISILQSQLEDLIKSSPNRDLMKLRFTLIVNYGNPINGDTPLTDRIEGVEITKFEKGMKQGDMNMEIEIPIIALNVKQQV